MIEEICIVYYNITKRDDKESNRDLERLFEVISDDMVSDSDLLFLSEAPAYDRLSNFVENRIDDWELLFHTGSKGIHHRGNNEACPKVMPQLAALKRKHIWNGKKEIEILPSSPFDGSGKRIEWLDIRKEVIELRIFLAHLYSKPSLDEDGQFANAVDARRDIDRIRAVLKRGNAAPIDENVVICGDLNMNPWEKGVTHSYAFHAHYAPAPFINEKQFSRKSGENDRSFFFNPGWQALGLANRAPSAPQGSFKYNPQNRESNAFTWNLFDQFLIDARLFDFENEFQEQSSPYLAVPPQFDILNIMELEPGHHHPVRLKLSFTSH